MIKVSILDSGVGIKRRDKSKLFKLGTSKVSTEGIGIGLVISSLIVKKFGGTIEFASKHKKGTCFQFSFKTQTISMTDLLLYQEKKTEKKTLKTKKSFSLQNGRATLPLNSVSFKAISDQLKIFEKFKRNRILVVDDEEFCLTSMKALLLKAGIDVQY